MTKKRSKLVAFITSLSLCLIGSINAFCQDKVVKAGENFKQENLVAWCIVPFDIKNRGPEKRAKMVRELGLKRVAYDWRKKNLPEFETEILEYKKNDVEFFAFWKWDDSMEPLIKKHGITPQIWGNFGGKQPEGTQQEKIDAVVGQFLHAATKAKSLGLEFGIYNHGGWAGQPENMIAICNQMRKKHGLENVGIVYNFHHAHEHIDGFAGKFKLLKPYLLCVNLNGMAEPSTVNEKTKENKILPIGSGVHERKLIQAIVESGYAGPIGVLGHRKEMDAKEAVQLNLDGLSSIIDTSKSEGNSPWEVIPLRPASQLFLPTNLLDGKWKKSAGFKVDDLTRTDELPKGIRLVAEKLVQAGPSGLRSAADYSLVKDGGFPLNVVTVRLFVFESATQCEQWWKEKYQVDDWEKHYEVVDAEDAIVVKSRKANKTIVVFGNVWLTTHQLRLGNEHIVAANHILQQLTEGKRSVPVPK